MPETTSLSSSTDRLALLYGLSQAFNSSLDLDEVLNRVMDEVIVATHAERGFVMLSEAGDRLNFRAARGIEQTTIETPQFQISRSVVEKVYQEGEPILTSDAQADERFNMRQSVVILGLRSILCVPLKIKQATIGVIYVDNRIQAGLFSYSDLELLNAIAATAAIAIENARLYQLAVEKGRLERELQMARQVQTNLLPRQTPQIPGWDFAALWLPARQVAGDYYDFIQLAPTSLGLVVADVTDKGMPAALFMALVRTLVRASVDRAASPQEAITQANHLICADASNGMFVTLFFGALDLHNGVLTYVNAGHNPPYHFCRATGELRRLLRSGMALGVDAEAPYDQQEVRLDPGDVVFLYTDGIPDALNAANQEFGLQRIEDLLLRYAQAGAMALLNQMENAIEAFIGSTASFDDITIVAVRRI